MKSVTYGRVNVENTYYWVAYSKKGVAFIGSENASEYELFDWCNTHSIEYSETSSREMLTRIEDAFKQYFKDPNSGCDLTFDLNGTPFQLKVWKALEQIQCGSLVSYSDLANSIQRPTAIRAVAYAVAKNPILVFIPCHRVIGKDNSLRGYRGGIAMKRRLIEHEQRYINLLEKK